MNKAWWICIKNEISPQIWHRNLMPPFALLDPLNCLFKLFTTYSFYYSFDGSTKIVCPSYALQKGLNHPECLHREKRKGFLKTVAVWEPHPGWVLLPPVFMWRTWTPRKGMEGSSLLGVASAERGESLPLTFHRVSETFLTYDLS